MSIPPTLTVPAPSDAPWYAPVLRMRLADGSWILRFGTPVQRATANQTAKWTGVSKKNLSVLAEAGYIRRAQPTPFTAYYYPAEVEAFIQSTEDDPAFWTKVRRATYIKARRLRDPVDRHSAPPRPESN